VKHRRGGTEVCGVLEEDGLYCLIAVPSGEFSAVDHPGTAAWIDEEIEGDA